MGLLDWFRRPQSSPALPVVMEAKASASGAAIAAFGVGLPVWTPRDYASYADEGYRRNAVAYRCAKLISSSAAAAPWLLYGKGGKEIEEHPLLDLLHRPNPMTTGSALFEAVYAYLLLSGNSYLERVGPTRADAAPRELWTLRPDRTRVIAGRAGLPQGYEYEANGRTIRWRADPLTGESDILHLREFNPLDDWYGMSRIEAAAYGIDRHNSASAHNKALLDNGARPSGALVFEPVRTSESAFSFAPEGALSDAEARLRNTYSGPTNAGRPLVLGGNVKWEAMGITPKDMDFGLGKDDAARDICNAFGVSHILIVPGASTYNNVREAKLDLWEDTILPLVDRMVDGLNNWLCPRFGDDLRLTIDLDEISALEPRRESKRKGVMELLTGGVIDREEAREALQYDPKPELVASVSGSTITALAGAVSTVGIGPLARYLRSVGLIDEATSDEDLLSAASSYLDETEPVDGEEDGDNPPPQDNPNPQDAEIDEGAADDEDE